MNKPEKTLFERLDWINTAFLLTTPILAIIALGLFFATGSFDGRTLLLAVVMGIASGISITGGYHRLFSHKTFEAHWFVKLFFLLFGAAAFQNSARKWSSDHRRHHKYTDTTRDPYNIKEGFFYAHMGWVMLKYDNDHIYDDVPDLISDPLVMFQEKYYLPLGIGVGFLMPMAVASLWGDPWGGLLLAGLVRTVLNQHFTFSINSFAHMIGKQPYSDSDSSRDNWFLAYFTYGEGYHNYHHKFPFDYRNGIKIYQWDPTKWLINGLAWVKMATGLKKVPNERILAARLQMDEKRLLRRIELGRSTSVRPVISKELVVSTRLKFEKAYAQFLEKSQEYNELRKTKLKAISDQVFQVNKQIEELKNDIQKARHHLNDVRLEWMRMCMGFGLRSRYATI